MKPRRAGKNAIIDFERMSQANIAKAFRVRAPSVHEWAAERGCPRNPDKTYSLPAVIAWREARAAGTKTEDDWSTEKDKWLALGHKARTLLLEGKLILLDEAAAFWADRVTVACTQFQGVGQALAPSLVGQDVRTIARRIDDRNRSICEELGREFEAALDEDEGNDGRAAGVDVAPDSDAE